MTELDEILHDLDHQKFEAIGVEALARETKSLMSALLLCIQAAGTSNAQDMAVLTALLEILQTNTCSRCSELSKRIHKQIFNDFQEFQERKERR